MAHALHPLLLRQLRRSAGVTTVAELRTALLAEVTPESGALEALLATVSESYLQFDHDLALRGRSLALSSEELTLANGLLRAEARGQQQLLQTLRASARALLPDLAASGESTPMADLQALAIELGVLLQQRLTAQAALGDSERQFRTLVANLPGCVYRRLHDAAPTMLYVSDAITDTIGWPASDFISGRRTLARQVHPQDRAYVVESISAAVEARQSYNILYRFRHADGSLRWANERGQGVYDEAGHLLHLDGVLFDRTESELAARELVATRQQLLDAVEALDIGVLMFDGADCVIVCNRKYREWHPGFESLLVRGTSCIDVLRAVYRSGLDPANDGAGEDAWLQMRLAQYRALDIGPRTREVALDGRLFRIDDSRTAGGITISLRTEVTATRNDMRQLELARDAAEDASRAKTRFLANMSHELRTPLHTVIGAAQLMKTGEHDTEQRVHLAGAIERSGNNLLGLIENILDLSRIEAGEMKLAPEDFHLVDCIDAALATAGLAARAKQLQLACIVGPNLPAWRHGDAARLRQTLLNLLGNAVKFTPTGDIVVRVERGPRANDIRIRVSDTGVGIAATSLPHIFQPFRQADDGADRRFGGSGLGLAIVHQLVDAMGGAVSVQSAPGEGSHFDIALALPPAHHATEEPPALRLRVAFVEPHDASAEGLHTLLQRMGCAVQRCTDAASLRQWCTEGAPSGADSWLLVCTDCAESGGILGQAADLLREHANVIGMSNVDAPLAKHGHPRMRLARNVIKPVSRAALASCFVARPLLGPAPMEPTFAPPPEAPRARTHVLVVEDDLLNQAIVGEMLRHAGYQVSTVSDGRAALDALRATPFDLVLMDWQMPDMDGLEATRQMRRGMAGPRGLTVPVVALTANAFAEDRVACLSAGMNDFLTKPIRSAKLMETIGRWTARPLSAIGPVAGTVFGNRAANLVFDPAVLAALPMVADGSQPDYAQELLELFVDGARRTLPAVRLAQAQGEHHALQRAMHTLKSSSASVGAMAMARLAEHADHRLRAGAAPPNALADLFETELLHLQAHVKAARETPAQTKDTP